MSSLTVDIKKKNFPKSGLKETFTVIDNLSFDITNNEFVCLVGPSGCGKQRCLILSRALIVIMTVLLIVKAASFDPVTFSKLPVYYHGELSWKTFN